MKYKLPMLLLLTLCNLSLFSQSFDYTPFFSAKVIDNEKTEFFFSDLRYFDSDKELKYFFWIRRGSELGTATYQLDFKKIKKIEFSDVYDNSIEGYTAAQMTLTSGEVFDVLVNTSGSVGGMDKDLGVYGEIYMNYNIIESIEFVHEGTYRKCPFCGSLFYESDLEVCSFDGTPLVDQHSAD